MSTHAVYRIFSEAGAPLYVGTTSRQWWVRVAEQACDHPEIANTAGRVEVTHHATREAAFEVESAEIARLLPRINMRGKWHEDRAFSHGELKDLIEDKIRNDGPLSSADLIAALPDVSPGSIRATMMRLRRAGAVRTIDILHGPGRPMHVVEWVEAESTAA